MSELNTVDMSHMSRKGQINLQGSLVALPPNHRFSASQLHELRMQGLAFKSLLTGGIFESDLVSDKSLGLEMLRARSAQSEEIFATSDRSVPGMLTPKGREFYIQLRLQHVEEETDLLSLRGIQEKFRKQTLRHLKVRCEDRSLEGALLDSRLYRRLPRQLEKSELRMEQNMRIGQEHKKRHRDKIGIVELLSHHREFFDYHIQKHVISIQQALRRHALGARTRLDKATRQELDKASRDEQERMQKLRDNDIEAYVNMLSEAKNERLLKILQQTDEFLQKLGAQVLFQKGVEEEQEQEEQLNQSQSITESFKISSRKFYELTHTIHEEIVEQPTGLEGGMLKSYQMQGLQWLVSLYNNNLHGILADEMGLGKTIQTIALFQYLIEKKNNSGPFLVVAPLGVLSNWAIEIKRWAPHIKAVVYKGAPQHRRHICQNLLFSRKFNVFLSTFEYIMKDKNQLAKIHWNYIVVDEGHRMKNPKSKFASTLSFQYNSYHRLLLTGTPLQNNLTELWSLLNFLLPKIFMSADDFEKWFNQPFSKLPGEKHVELTEEENMLIISRLHQVLRPFLLRRVKREVETELPDLTEFVLKVELSFWQKTLYTNIKKRGYLNIDPVTGRAHNLNNTVMQLRKVCNHPYLFISYHQVEVSHEIWRCSGKFELLDRIIPKLIATGHKTLIFSQMTQLLDVMQLYFDFRGFAHLRLDGSTKEELRTERVQLFNNPASKIFLFMLSTRAGGLGLNLQAADTVIIFDSDWNPQVDLQAQGRAHRIGSKSEVRVFRLVTNTPIEEAILSKAAHKKDIDTKAIQIGLFNNRSTAEERTEKLKMLLRNEEEEESQEDAVLTDSAINDQLARNDEEWEIYEKMDKEREMNECYESRLIAGGSLPDWLSANEEKRASIYYYGRGFRTRKNVSYSELPTKRENEPSHDQTEKKQKVQEQEGIASDEYYEASSGSSVDYQQDDY